MSVDEDTDTDSESLLAVQKGNNINTNLSEFEVVNSGGLYLHKFNKKKIRSFLASEKDVKNLKKEDLNRKNCICNTEIQKLTIPPILFPMLDAILFNDDIHDNIINSFRTGKRCLQQKSETEAALKVKSRRRKDNSEKQHLQLRIVLERLVGKIVLLYENCCFLELKYNNLIKQRLLIRKNIQNCTVNGWERDQLKKFMELLHWWNDISNTSAAENSEDEAGKKELEKQERYCWYYNTGINENEQGGGSKEEKSNNGDDDTEKR